ARATGVRAASSAGWSTGARPRPPRCRRRGMPGCTTSPTRFQPPTRRSARGKSRICPTSRARPRHTCRRVTRCSAATGRAPRATTSPGHPREHDAWRGGKGKAMRRNVIETIMGAVVLVVAALFLLFAYSSSNLHAVGGYDVMARFNRVDGLTNGADVRLSGIKIGSVVSQALDPKTYLAEGHLSVTDSVKLPVDSTARIQSDSLLGSAYINIEPGGDEKMLASGGEIKYTQDPVNLADLIGRFIFSSGGKKPGEQGQGGQDNGAPAPAPSN